MESLTRQISKEAVLNVLKTVLDPEIEVNIVDLGLIYSVDIEKGKSIRINMTLTTPGCPMGDAIISDIQAILDKYFPDYEKQINLVWHPAWNTNMISPEGRGFLGY